MRDFVREERMFSEAARFRLAGFVQPGAQSFTTMTSSIQRKRQSSSRVRIISLFGALFDDSYAEGDKLTANSLFRKPGIAGPPESDEWSLGWPLLRVGLRRCGDADAC